jgi:hypothetical protein
MLEYGQTVAYTSKDLANEVLQIAEQELYSNPAIKEQLFTDDFLEKWAEQLGVNSDALKELIISNKDLIIEMSAMTKSINAQDEVLLTNRLNSYGSNMSTKEMLDGLGVEKYSDFVDTFKDDIQLTEKDYKDYATSIGAEFNKVENGKVYYTKGDKEDSIDLSTLTNIKAEELAEGFVYNNLVSMAKSNVSSLGLKGDEGLSDESYIRLDNLQRNVDNMFIASVGENTNNSYREVMAAVGDSQGQNRINILAEQEQKYKEYFGDDNFSFGDYTSSPGNYDFDEVFNNLQKAYEAEAEKNASAYTTAF